jgi:hypothetical protein
VSLRGLLLHLSLSCPGKGRVSVANAGEGSFPGVVRRLNVPNGESETSQPNELASRDN